MADADADLHEFVDAEFQVEGVGSATAEADLLAALDGRDGIRRVRLNDDKLFVEYEPVRIVKRQIIDALGAAGFRVKEIGHSQASPVVDAVHEEDGQ